MRLQRPRPLAPLCSPALVAAAAFTSPASGSDVTGKSGTDTSLKVTDSKRTVSGRGQFADVKFTVNQTKNLVNQAVSVTWSGAASTPPRYTANYMQLMQCWGEDDGTNPDNPGPPPTQCVFGASNAVYGGLSLGLFPDGSYATERIISTEGWENFDRNGGVYDERTRWLWQPFRAVDGTEVGVHYDPTYNPERPVDEEGNPKSYWLNPKFNVATTNEIAPARTGKNGTGGELFEVMTGIESSGLGCGQAVEPVAGGKRVPKCWLVVVPRGAPADENAGTPSADRAEEFGVMTSPLAPNSWKNRIAIPLEFTPVDSNCSLADDQRRIVGSELIVPAVSSWQLKLCETPGRLPYTYVPIPDASARQQLMNPSPGSPGMVVVSRPVAQESLDPDNPVAYAPVSLSGVVIGFNVERFTHPAADSDAQQLSGVRVAEINLTPRLLAKLLTQSYRSQVEIQARPSPYEWVKSNPTHLATDMEFLQFNPEFAELLVQAGKNFGGLVMPVGNSDLAHQVWEYILADPEAKAWLDGTPDPHGMKVNPLYATTAAANSSGEAFGDPTPRSFPKSDPYCYEYEGEPVGPNHDVVPLPLCGTDWVPYARSLREDARITRLADDGAKVVVNGSATSPDQAYKRDLPQRIGSRVMLSITDTASAFRYGIQTARLSRAGDNGSGRKFIAADSAGLTAGLAAMKPGAEPAVIEPDPKASAPDGYPLAALTYAAIRPLALDATARQEYADFVAYGAGDGQVPGFGDGKLPEGYAPLPATLKTQALNAAKTIRELTLAALAAAATTGSDASSGSSADSGFDAGSGFDSFGLGGSSGGSLSFDDPATIASPSAGSPSLASRIKRFLTPAVSTPPTRFVLPFLAVLALAAGFGAAEVAPAPPLGAGVMRRAAWQVALAAIVVIAGSSGPLPGRAVAAGEAAGNVVVTNPTSSSRITRGGSATAFTLKLPKNATCPGDSADDDYRVQTFLVPKGTNVASMRFKSEGPDVPDAWGIYDVTTSAYMQEFTDDAEGKRQPGAILPLPALNFAVFTGGELKPGRYEMGVACSLYNEMKKFWSTDIVIHADEDDEPARLRWELPGESPTSSGTPFMALVAGGIVLTAAVAIFVVARRPA